MLAELVVLESILAAPSPKGALHARLMLPSGRDDIEEWLDCGDVDIHLEASSITHVDIVVNSRFWNEIQEEYPQDAEVADLERETLVSVVAYNIPRLTEAILADSVLITVASTGRKNTFLFDTRGNQITEL